MKAIEIRGYGKYFGEKKVVDGLSFDVHEGEIFAFIGHNGAGKTTTLRSLVGILDFEEGEILIHGHSIDDEPETCKQMMAYVPDNPELYDYMRAGEYINFVCDIYGVPEEARAERVDRYAEIFGMADKMRDEISTFSHGMKQKIALIAALAHDPEILVLDEPFVGLDPKAVFEVKNLMKKMAKAGKTILFSTHILDVAEKLCDHVAIIREGKLVTTGTMKEIRGDKSLEEVFLGLGGPDGEE